MAVTTKLGGVLLTLLVLNYAFAALFGFAPVYCIGKAVLEPLLAWLTFANLTLFVLAFSAGVLGRRELAVEFLLGMILLNALPSIASSAFGLGTSCSISDTPSQTSSEAPCTHSDAGGRKDAARLPTKRLQDDSIGFFFERQIQRQEACRKGGCSRDR